MRKAKQTTIRPQHVLADALVRSGTIKTSRVATVLGEEAVMIKTLASPEAAAYVQRLQKLRLQTDILPIAIKTMKAMLESDATPAGAKATLIKLAIQTAFSLAPDEKELDPSRLPSEAIRGQISELDARAVQLEADKEALRAILADRATVVNAPAPATPERPVVDDLFA